jgi:hypothetical protein
MDDRGVADAFYTVLSIGIVLVAAIAVSGVVLSATTTQGDEAAAQMAGYGDSGLKKGLYCFYYEVDGTRSDAASGDSDSIVFQRLALERAEDVIAMNFSAAPPGAPTSSGAALWSGYLYVPESGSYEFELKSAGQAWLWIDGSLAADNRKPISPQSNRFALYLTKGNHPIKAKYFYPELRMASCSLDWELDGHFVPVNAFYR